MALAYLSKQWEKSRPNNMSVTAFVVDHKAREESTREANVVSQWLQDIGIYAPSHTLTFNTKQALTKKKKKNLRNQVRDPRIDLAREHQVTI